MDGSKIRSSIRPAGGSEFSERTGNVGEWKDETDSWGQQAT